MEESKQEHQKQFVRQTAKVASIKEINTGTYVKQEGWEPNYILSVKNEKLSRVNVIGIVVTVPESSQSIFIEDGSSKIEVRTFEEDNIFKNITIGDIVLIIGRPREYNNEIYINADIIKKISNKGWLEYRKKEIIVKNITMPDVNKPAEKQEPPIVEHNMAPIEETKEDEQIDEIDSLLLKIKDLDSGNGCDVQELIEINPSYENVIEQLLLKGEIFELGPGKIKVLE